MLILMKQHGRMILCCVAAILVLFAAFGISFDGKQGAIRFAVDKAMEDMEPMNIGSGRDVAAALAAAARSRPEITYAYTKTVSKIAVNLNAMFSAMDAEGNNASIEITDILDASGESVLYETKEHKRDKIGRYDTEAFLFPSAGVYTAIIKAVDTENKVSCGQYKIPVAGS